MCTNLKYKYNRTGFQRKTNKKAGPHWDFIHVYNDRGRSEFFLYYPCLSPCPSLIPCVGTGNLRGTDEAWHKVLTHEIKLRFLLLLILVPKHFCFCFLD